MKTRSVYTNSLDDCVRLQKEIRESHKIARRCGSVGDKYVFSYYIKKKF